MGVTERSATPNLGSGARAALVLISPVPAVHCALSLRHTATASDPSVSHAGPWPPERPAPGLRRAQAPVPTQPAGGGWAARAEGRPAASLPLPRNPPNAAAYEASGCRA